MAGRPKDPLRSSRMKAHRSNGYLYAATSAIVKGKNGNPVTKYTQWGTLNDGKVFVPNLKFIMSPRAVRDSFIFPSDWDISAALQLNEQAPEKEPASVIDTEQTVPEQNARPAPLSLEHTEDVRKAASQTAPRKSLPYRDLLYGTIWFLMQIAEAKHVIEDLMVTFEYKQSVVNDILTMAIFPYITRRNFDRLARSQRIYHYPSENTLTPPYITAFTQQITAQNRMDFCKLRIDRQPDGAYLACDSTTRSAWGDCIAEIHFGRNKDNKELNCTLEVVVYSLSTHEPVFYRMFPGNEPDARTLHTVNSELAHLGIHNLVTIFDRGYESTDNFDDLFRKDLAFIACAKVAQEPVINCLLQIQYDSNGIPTNMAYDPEYRVFYAQFMIENRSYQDDAGVPHTVAKEDFRCNVFLNPADRPFELIAVNNDVEEEGKKLAEKLLSGELVREKDKINRKLCYHKVIFVTDEESHSVTARIEKNESAIARAKAQCGFFSSVTYKAPGDALAMLKAYKTRDEQEKYFEQMKDQMDFHTQDASSQDGRAGREFILFVGLILSSTVRNTWRSNVELRKALNTSLSVLDEMENIRWIQYEDGEERMTEFCGLQVEICKAFNIKVPRDCLPVLERKAEERKESPKKRGRKPSGTPAPNKINVVQA